MLYTLITFTCFTYQYILYSLVLGISVSWFCFLLLRMAICKWTNLHSSVVMMFWCNNNVVVVRDGDTVKHYRIRQLDDGGFFIARRATFTTIANLVEHYSRDSDGLCMNLRKACTQVVNVLGCRSLLIALFLMFLYLSICPSQCVWLHVVLQFEVYMPVI